MLEVELTLTPQEAAKGGRIAIEVPIPTACSSCGGHGELAWRVCPRCGGRGIVQAVCPAVVVIPRHVRDRLVIPAPIINGSVQLRVHLRIRE